LERLSEVNKEKCTHESRYVDDFDQIYCSDCGVNISNQTRPVTGLDAQYYDLPEDATQLQDLIEYKEMNFSVGNMFKAIYRLNDKSTKLYNLEKIIFYAQREINRLK
jgi:hypothetical protein